MSANDSLDDDLDDDLDGVGGDDSFDALLRDAAHVPTFAIPMPEKGTLLRGRFEVVRRLGEGGMGVVYEVRDQATGGTLALKTLTRLDAAYIHRLKQEFRSLSDTVHPNLVGFHELFSDGNQWFFTMDLVDGHDFLHFDEGPPTADRSQLSVIEAADLARGIVRAGPEARPVWHHPGFRPALEQLVLGVDAIHQAGKLHRDLKPSNVLVTEAGHVMILDFGLVADQRGHSSGRPADHRLSGTPAYMAPEQAAGEPATRASDWYAVGVMLYQALTGKLPFEGSVADVMEKKQHADPASPTSLQPDLPKDLAQLSMALLRREPRKRPEVAEILEAAGGPAESREPTTTHSIAPGSLVRPVVADSFVGRDAQTRQLQEAFDKLARGAPRVVFVHGSSGMGKTALVGNFVDGLDREGRALVLSARCYEREAVPFKAFDGIIDELVHYLRGLPDTEAEALLPRDVHSLVRVFPALTHVSAIKRATDRQRQPEGDLVELRQRVFRAIREMLTRICERTPLVVVIDDLQWSDVDSARLLEAILAPPMAPSVLVIGVFRREDVESSDFLQQILRRPRVPVSSEEFARRRVAAMLRRRETATGLRVPVEAARATMSDGSSRDLEGPLHADPERERVTLRSLVPVDDLAVDRLSTAEAILLTRTLLHGLPGDIEAISERVALEADGVPFYIQELAQYLRGQAQSNASLAPDDVALLADVLKDRLGALPDTALRLLQVVVIAGRPIRQDLALKAAWLTAGERRSFDLLRALSLVRTRGPSSTDEVEVYHDRVRVLVVGQMRQDVMRHVHARLASILEQSGDAKAEWLAEHFQRAGMGDRAGEYAVEAASQARGALAFFGAADLYRWAQAIFRSQDAATVRRGTLRGAVYGAFGGLALASILVPLFQMDASRANQVATFVVGVLAGGPIGMMVGSLVTLLSTEDPTTRIDEDGAEVDALRDLSHRPEATSRGD